MALTNAPNAPANIGDTIAFRENPFMIALTLPLTYAITPPVTAELWFRDELQTDQVVAVSVVGQRISVSLTVVQLRALVKAKLYIKFGAKYEFFTAITATMGGAIPSTKEITISVQNIGEIIVSTYNDPATVGTMQKLLSDTKILADKAKVSEDRALEYMNIAKANAAGAVDASGTFNAATGQARQFQTLTTPGEVFTPTAVSTKAKGFVMNVIETGTSSISGETITATKGGSYRSNGVGFGWTYLPPTDTGFELITDLVLQMPTRNLYNNLAAISGKGRQSTGPMFDNAGYAYILIEVEPSTTYTGWGPNPANLIRYACMEGATHGVIAGAGWNATPVSTFTTPSNCYFVGLTILLSEINTFQLEKGAEKTQYIKYGGRVGEGVYLPAANIILDDDHQFPTLAQLNTLGVAADLASKFKYTNLANPANFTTGTIITSLGAAVASGTQSNTGEIDVEAGQVMSMNTLDNTGFRYGCFKQLGGAVVPSSGWNGVNTLTVTVPVGAVKFIGTYPTAFQSSVMVEIAPAPTGYVPFGKLSSDEILVKAIAVAEGSDRYFATAAEKARLATLVDLDDKYRQYELKGLLQHVATYQSPVAKDMGDWTDLLLEGIEDVVVEEDNGSISTGVAGYCSPTPNSHLLPEFCREQNFWTFWVQHMLGTYFIGQKHARFDTPSFFTIGGTVTTVATNNDVHWGHQYPNGGDDFGGPNPSGQIFFDRYYQVITPTSGNASITFNLPDSYWKACWMLSHSHLTGTYTFSVAGGANRLEYEITPGVWAELHGATWDTATPDEFKTVIFGTSTKIRKDQHSMPFKIRRKPGFTLSGSIAITATMGGGKRIEHWGLYYTRAKRLFIPVCSAKGSHDLVSLRAFYEFGIDKRKPNLYIMSCPTINEWRVGSVTPTDTPSQYAARFVSHATDMLNTTTRPWIKAVFARFRGTHVNMNNYEAAGDMPTEYLTTEGYNSGFDYLRVASKGMRDLRDANPGRMAFVDLTVAYQTAVNNYATYFNVSRRTAMWVNNGSDPANANTITMDGTHEGNMGVRVGWRSERNNWII
jgi:hypothetical protein